MTRDSLIKLLNRKKKSHKTWAKLAAALGISPQYLSDIQQGRREPSEAFLEKLGLVEVKTYHQAAK
jgi:transcriptional regulator with XRE-family HTH domain